MLQSFRFPCLCTLAAGLLLTGAVRGQGVPSFQLSFDGPDTVGGLPGTTIQFPVRVLLTTSGLPAGSEGPSGWTFGVTAGADCRIVSLTTAGTVADPTEFGGRRVGGFSLNEITKGAGNEGAVSATALSLPGPGQGLVTLDPGTTHALLAMRVEALVPRDGGCIECTLAFSGQLQGSGDPVRLVVSYNNTSFTPATIQKTVRICPVACFPRAPIPDWRQFPLGETVAPAARMLDGVFELCSWSPGYGPTSDSILSVAQEATADFEIVAEVLSLEGAGVAGIEARSFTGTGGDPDAPFIGIRVEADAVAGKPVDFFLRASFRDVQGGKASGGDSPVLRVQLPIVLRVRGDGKSLRVSHSVDRGKTFEPPLLEVPAERGLGSGFFRLGMVQSSTGEASSLASFRDPRTLSSPSADPPRIPVSTLAPFSGSPDEATVLTIPGRGFEGVQEVLVAGLPARVLKVDETSLTVEVPPTKGPVRGDIVVRTPFGTSVIPNSFFSATFEKYIRCDCNGDGVHDISDALALLGKLFLGTAPCKCHLAGDCNGDGVDDITDAIYGLTFLFVGNTAMPDPPYPNPGGACGVSGAQLPTIESISQTTIQEGDIFTIRGRNFSDDPRKNAVVAGDAEFEILDASADELVVQAQTVVTERTAELIVITDFSFLPIFCRPGKCPPLLIGPAVRGNLPPVQLIPSSQIAVLGSSEVSKDGTFEIMFDRDQFDPLEEVSVSASIIGSVVEGVSPGARSVNFRHGFSNPQLSFERGLSELAKRLGEELGGGGPLPDFTVIPDPEGERILVEPTTRLREAIEVGLAEVPSGVISFYGPPIGRCGPSNLHPKNDEREFGWCRLQELVKNRCGLPAFEWFIPKSFVITESEDLSTLPDPNDRSPFQKMVMYNKAAYCHVRRHKLWNKCKQEDLVDLAGGDTDIPPFPRDAWVLKCRWTSNLPPSMLALVPPGKTPQETFYSYVYSGDGQRYYLIALHHTTKDINDWFWYDLYPPAGDTTNRIGGCGGRNDDIPAGLAGTVWSTYYLCTDVDHTQPITEQSSPFQAGWCGNFQFSPECPDSIDLLGGEDTCMNCHDPSTPGLLMAGASASFPAGNLDLDFLFSLRTNIRVPNPCDAVVSSVNYSLDIQPIWSSNCSCHLGASPPHGLGLGVGSSHGNLVNVNAAELPSMKRVAPNSTANSYLWHKLNGTHGAVGGSGGQMPLGGTPLGSADLNLIQQWINGGANP